jgi:hypothetical protein
MITDSRAERYKGTTTQRGKWIAQIVLGGRVYRLGTFPSERVAAQVYDAAAYWLNGGRDGRVVKYNFPNDISNDFPPLINARLREVMDEAGFIIPVDAPTETPFVEIFHQVMSAWFTGNPLADVWEGTTGELLPLFKFATGCDSVRHFGILLAGLKGIQRRTSNGKRFINIRRGDIEGTTAVHRVKLDRASYKTLLVALRRLYVDPSPERLQRVEELYINWLGKARAAFKPQREAQREAQRGTQSNAQGGTQSNAQGGTQSNIQGEAQLEPISLPVMCDEAKSAIVANESNCAVAQSAPQLQQTSE